MPPRNELGREAVSALATVAVVVGGTVVLVFVIVVSTDQPGPYLGGVAGGVAVLCLLLFLVRSQPDDPNMKRRPWWKAFRRRGGRPQPQIIVKRRSEPDHDIHIDTNQPPTAEQLRDLKDHGSTWVPNRTVNRQ